MVQDNTMEQYLKYNAAVLLFPCVWHEEVPTVPIGDTKDILILQCASALYSQYNDPDREQL